MKKRDEQNQFHLTNSRKEEKKKRKNKLHEVAFSYLVVGLILDEKKFIWSIVILRPVTLD